MTIRDVAARAGVSISTASNALSGNRPVNGETARLVRRAAEELGYRPDSLAQALITGRSRTVGLVLPDIVNPFFPSVARGAEDAACELAYSLILCNTDLRPEREQEAVETLLARRVDGILFMPGAEGSREVVELLPGMGVPFVLMDEPFGGDDAPGVYSDNVGGGYQAGRHLLEVGCRSMAFVGGPAGLPTVQQRLGGFRSALEGAGRQPCATVFGTYRMDDGHRLMSRLLDEGVPLDGVFAADDLLALGAIEALTERGRAVPEDVAVCGFDDIAWARLVTPSLTTVVQRAYELGAVAARALIGHLTGLSATIPRIVLPVELAVRASTRRRPLAAALHASTTREEAQLRGF